MTAMTLTLCIEPTLKSTSRRNAWLSVMAMLTIVFFSPLSLIAQVTRPPSVSGRDKIQTDLLDKLESELQAASAKAHSQPAARYKIIVSLQKPSVGHSHS